jgi:DtxR family Mn-dependent transcriptional regulator
MASITVENYLKHISLEAQRHGGRGLVPTGVLADAVGVTPGTATTMVKSLAEARLLKYEAREGVRLTAAGHRLANRVLRRHRLVERFLVEVLDMDWAEVHDEAEDLEHAISDKVLERIDALLGHPETDPHGSPIPRGDRALSPDDLPDLSVCAVDQPYAVARIIDHDAAFLRFAEKHGLTPGSEITVTERSAHGDAVRIDSASAGPVVLGLAAARRVRVQPAD